MDEKPKPNLAEEGKKIDKKGLKYLKMEKSPHPALRFWGKVLAVLSITILIVGVAISFKVISSISSQGKDESGGKISFFQQISHLLTQKDEGIMGEEEDRINILLMGVGGAGHQGSLLTDTIILASLKPSTKQVALLSIPRDLTVEFPGDYYWRKINNALFFGREMDYPGGGEALLTDTVSDITGLDIHYYARVDFAGFTQVIDGLGGLEIDVERSFTDYEYPTSDYGFQTISFKAGQQVMSGATALKYVRSRHGNNSEGSDFARAQRQQKILVALKDKVTSFSTLINPKKISDILTTLGTHTKTDMEIWEMLRLYNLSQNIGEDKMITKVLDNSKGGLLQTQVGQNGAYILVPNVDDFSEVKSLAKDIFNQNNIEKEEAKIAVENGTSTVGLAQATANELESLDYNVVRIANYSQKNIEKTIIYDSTGGKTPHTLEFLEEKFNVSTITSLPFLFETLNPNQEINIDSLEQVKNINTSSSSDYDILIILGADRIPPSSLTYN